MKSDKRFSFLPDECERPVETCRCKCLLENVIDISGVLERVHLELYMGESSRLGIGDIIVVVAFVVVAIVVITSFHIWKNYSLLGAC